MTMNRRHFNRSLLSLLGLPLLPAAQAEPAPPVELVEGRDWRALSPPQTSGDSDRIEVLEFFSYGCPHCARLNPLLTPWVARLPADVRFQRVPVTFGRAAWASLARLYYALEYSGDLERLDQLVFEAVGTQRVRLFDEAAILDWLSKHEVDTNAFKAHFNSFAVETRFNRGEVLTQRYHVDGVPMLAVAGRYVVVGRESQGFSGWLEIADALIAKARSERNAPA